MNFLKVLILAVVQGACELLPVSSSAHVIIASKLMNMDPPSSPPMTFLLILLHTGTMFAVIVYFWRAWREHYFASAPVFWDTVRLVAVASFLTAIVYKALELVIKKAVMRGAPDAEIENLFDNLPLIAGALFAVGVLIIVAGLFNIRPSRTSQIGMREAAWIGAVQGLCIPFRGFSRSGATISTGLILGAPKQRLEEFSFALAVVLTPAAIAKEAHRLLKSLHGIPASQSPGLAHVALPGLVGMFCSFAAGLLALRLLSRWLEGGRWQFFGFYCLAVSAFVFFLSWRGY